MSAYTGLCSTTIHDMPLKIFNYEAKSHSSRVLQNLNFLKNLNATRKNQFYSFIFRNKVSIARSFSFFISGWIQIIRIARKNYWEYMRSDKFFMNHESCSREPVILIQTACNVSDVELLSLSPRWLVPCRLYTVQDTGTQETDGENHSICLKLHNGYCEFSCLTIIFRIRQLLLLFQSRNDSLSSIY